MAIRYRKERLDRGIKVRTEDIFALSSYQEILYLVLPRALPVIFLLTFPLLKGFVGLYWEKVLIITCITALLALSWDLLASVGLISLGQAIFFGAGAYITGYLNHSFGWPPLVTIPLGTLAGALFCTLLLLPVLRVRGVYFAIVTLTLPLLLVRVIEATKILGGTEGLVASHASLKIFGLSSIFQFWPCSYASSGSADWSIWITVWCCRGSEIMISPS